MTIKHHIIISVTISLALISIIACQNKPQTTKEDKDLNDKIKTQVTKVEDTVLKAQDVVAKAEAEAKEAAETAGADAKELEEEAKSVEAKANEKIKEVENKVDETTEKIESEVETIENKIEDTTESEEDKGPKNLFVNGDFNDGFSEWSHDKDVSIVEVDGKKCVECIAPADIKEQTRIWQTINTTSGHVYKLSFKVKAEKKGAFAIFRDHQNNKEQYLFADASEEWKEYQENFKSNKDGEYKVFLSCQGKGKYYFSDASIIDASLEQE